MVEHKYEIQVQWTGNLGTGTSGYRAYSRDHEIVGPAGSTLPPITASADPAFRGDAARWNPEQLLLASLSQCHMLWYLHLAAVNNITVLSYTDTPVGSMDEHPDGSGEFVGATLRPVVTISAESDAELATKLHEKAHSFCFIARSVNFPVDHEATTVTAN